jgi:hypothetical protein
VYVSKGREDLLMLGSHLLFFFRAFLILDPVVMPLLSGKITTCTQNDDFNPLGNTCPGRRKDLYGQYTLVKAVRIFSCLGLTFHKEHCRFSPVSSLFFRAFLILDPVVMPLLSGKITTCTQNRWLTMAWELSTPRWTIKFGVPHLDYHYH